MAGRMRLAVLVSGGGTNLQSIIDHCLSSDFPAEVVAVASNVPDAYGLKRAEQAGIPALVVPHRCHRSREEHERQLLRQLEPFRPELCVLAGYMRVVTPLLLQAFYDQKRKRPGVINIHPADTRRYQGAHGYEFALGMLPEHPQRLSQTFITVHFVDAGVDTGPIILQAPVPVLPEDTLDTLRERGLKIEHQLYPRAIRLVAEEKVRLENGRVHLVE